MLRAFAEPSGTDLALLNRMKHEPSEPIALNVAARETREMNPVALLTPTYGRDLELCRLLCESVDRHVTSFSKHYLLVPDADLSLFSHFESERREVIPASRFLPHWLRPLPRVRASSSAGRQFYTRQDPAPLLAQESGPDR